jgi:glutathione synthase/RimK-type ligase-like ATP-grasp enzyme
MAGTIVLATAADQPDITASDMLYAEALRRHGCVVVGAPWNGPGTAFDGAAAVVIRSTWGYYRELVQFRAWTEAMAASTVLLNPIALVRWNLRKDYISKLAAAGVRVPDTRIVPRQTAAIEQVFDANGWQCAVVKPTIGGGGHSVELLTRDAVREATDRLAGEDVLVQEFLPEIGEGELSLIYFDGVFSHAIRKRPPRGEFRVKSRFGATRTTETPSRDVVEQAAAALRALPELPLYARVDGVVRDGALIVVEVEVLEPALFMELDPASAERFAEATVRRLSD